MNSRPLKYLFGWIVAAAVVILFLLGRFSAVLVDWLWFGELGYEVVFMRLLLLRLALGVVAGLAAFVFLGLNLKVAFRRALAGGMRAESAGNVVEILPGEKYRIPPPLLQWGAWLLAAFVAIPFGLYFGEQWDAALRYLWGEPVGRVDPIYGRDLGFYLFDLPFLQILQNSLTFLAFLALAAALGLVALTGLLRRQGQGFAPPRRPAALHLALTCLLFLAGHGWGYILERYELLYSLSGAVHGAGYADLQVVRLGLWAMAAASAALGLTVLLGYWRNRLQLALWGAGGYLVLLVALLMAAPWAVQSFIVKPNELELETPFLQHEIAFTREAYGLDRVEERSYPALSDLTREKVNANRQTLRNVRLWDWRPLLQTFRQLQDIRLYYQFYEVDVDRYMLDGEYRQAILSSRELAPELPERAGTWVNRTLQFTHGYDLVMSLAAQEGEGGTPTFLVQDLPPKTSRGLELERPAVFFGKMMPGYRIVNTGVEELDYPKGDENVYGRLLVYKLPKEKLILGPIQVEAMIDQDPLISRQLSLWDQRGSRVIRGNLLVIPLGHSFIYVEPVYLIAEGNDIPQLRRVIVAYNEPVAMEPTLEQAVAAVFGPTAAAPEEAAAPEPARAVPPANWEEARASFERAQKALQEGNWQEFGRAMGELQGLLQREKEPAP